MFGKASRDISRALNSIWPNVAAQWLTLLLRIHGFPGSNLCLGTGHYGTSHIVLLSPSICIPGWHHKLGQCRFVSHLFQSVSKYSVILRDFISARKSWPKPEMASTEPAAPAWYLSNAKRAFRNHPPTVFSIIIQYVAEGNKCSNIPLGAHWLLCVPRVVTSQNYVFSSRHVNKIWKFMTMVY
jgi:hypothetical protein